MRASLRTKYLNCLLKNQSLPNAKKARNERDVVSGRGCGSYKSFGRVGEEDVRMEVLEIKMVRKLGNLKKSDIEQMQMLEVRKVRQFEFAQNSDDLSIFRRNFFC